MACKHVEWLPLETNPNALNKFLRRIGIPEPTHCVDVLGFDDDLIALLPHPIHAILFCFPDFKKYEEKRKPIYDNLISEGGGKISDDIFFMEQLIDNACGTFALFHSLANNAENIDLGQGVFKNWLEIAKNLNPKDRSNSLANSAELASSHKSCAEAGSTDISPDELDHHFICYVHKNGSLYEIDSRAPFPRNCGPTSLDKFVHDAGMVCQTFMDDAENVRFGTIALVGSRHEM